MKICATCQAQCPDEADVCGQCGSPLAVGPGQPRHAVIEESPSGATLAAEPRARGGPFPLRSYISLASALAALVGFFLPWFQLSCGGERVASPSGWQVAVGVDTLGHQHMGHFYLFLLPLGLVALMLLLSVSLLQGGGSARILGRLQIAAGLLCLLMPVIEYLRFRAEAAESTSAGIVGVEVRFGFWLTLISGGALAFLGLLALARERPPRKSS